MPDKKHNYHGFCISHEDPLFQNSNTSGRQQGVRQRTYYHKNIEVIENWVSLLRQESSNLSFEERYIGGPKLGNGKFSTVYQC